MEAMVVDLEADGETEFLVRRGDHCSLPLDGVTLCLHEVVDFVAGEWTRILSIHGWRALIEHDPAGSGGVGLRLDRLTWWIAPGGGMAPEPGIFLDWRDAHMRAGLPDRAAWAGAFTIGELRMEIVSTDDGLHYLLDGDERIMESFRSASRPDISLTSTGNLFITAPGDGILTEIWLTLSEDHWRRIRMAPELPRGWQAVPLERSGDMVTARISPGDDARTSLFLQADVSECGNAGCPFSAFVRNPEGDVGNLRLNGRDNAMLCGFPNDPVHFLFSRDVGRIRACGVDIALSGPC